MSGWNQKMLLISSESPWMLPPLFLFLSVSASFCQDRRLISARADQELLSFKANATLNLQGNGNSTEKTQSRFIFNPPKLRGGGGGVGGGVTQHQLPGVQTLTRSARSDIVMHDFTVVTFTLLKEDLNEIHCRRMSANKSIHNQGDSPLNLR